MALQSFPALAGIAWSVERQEIWQTRLQTAASGKEARQADWTAPRHQWDLAYEFLRQGTIAQASYAEYAELQGFFDRARGMFGAFLYQDADDRAATGQVFGLGDGATLSFPLVKSFGNYVEPVYALTSPPAVYKTDWQGTALQYATARTNHLANNTMLGAAAGTPGTVPTGWAQTGAVGGLVSSVVGAGFSGGLHYLDFRLSGTATSGSAELLFFGPTNPLSAVPTTPGTVWTASVFLGLQAGSVAHLNRIVPFLNPETSGGSGIANIEGANLIAQLTGTPQRFSVTGVMPALTAYVSSAIRLDFSSGAAVDITLRIGAPQLETGSTATSVIYTGGTPVTVTDYSLTANSLGQDTVVTFATAPAAGATLTADTNHAYVCRFAEDDMTFSKFMSTLHEAKKVSILSLK